MPAFNRLGRVLQFYLPRIKLTFTSVYKRLARIIQLLVTMVGPNWIIHNANAVVGLVVDIL